MSIGHATLKQICIKSHVQQRLLCLQAGLPQFDIEIGNTKQVCMWNQVKSNIGFAYLPYLFNDHAVTRCGIRKTYGLVALATVEFPWL